MGIFWIIQVRPKCNLKHPHKKDIRQKRRRQRDLRGRAGSYVVTRQGRLAATRSQKGQGVESALGPLKGVRPCWHLDFGPVILLLDF